MPGRRCAVYGCNNSRVSTKVSNPNIVYHNFPKERDSVSDTIRKEWIRRCKRADKWNPKTSQICSEHFSGRDYERDIRNKVMGLPLRKLLKKSSVPTLKLPIKTLKVKGSTSNERNLKKKKTEKEIQTKKEINKLIAVDTTSTSALQSKPSCSLEVSTNKEMVIDHIMEPDEKVSKEKYDTLLKNYITLQSQLKIIKRKSNLQVKQLQYYKSKSRTPKRTLQQEDGMNLLKKILTENQISILCNKKKRVNWSIEEISVALTLRYFSKKAYVYLRSKLNFPLPALSTLKSWASKIRIKPGVLEDFMTFLNVAGENMTAKEKIVVIMFDEVKVNSTLEYDGGEDQVLTDYNQMQVCLVRGLFSSWKQPIYLDFDKKMTKDILMHIITQLHNISYNCVAMVSECGGDNVGLWKELSVDINNTSFNHPQTGNRIHVFADHPHLLKLVRNGLLDTGFILEENRIINKAPLKCLIELTETEVNVCCKISDRHITVEKSQRQNLRIAAELMSHTTAQALLRYKPGSNPKLAENVGKFIDDINSWFDIFNSHLSAKHHSDPLKTPYGLHLELQNEHLDKIESMIANMKAIGRGNALQVFQTGIIMSIRSLKLLLEDMKTQFDDVHCLCTHKLTQDCLENMFVQIRCRGPNDHPSPLEAMKRLRMIVLGKNPGILDAQVNTHETVPEEYVVARVLEQANVSINFPVK